jgi:hypothetical protein
MDCPAGIKQLVGLKQKLNPASRRTSESIRSMMIALVLIVDNWTGVSPVFVRVPTKRTVSPNE